MSAEFKVIKVDPQGSGMDYAGHLGMTVTDAQRCCKNCWIIFGTIDNRADFGPFVPGELQPLNQEARDIIGQIKEEYPGMFHEELSLFARIKSFVFNLIGK